MEFLFPLMLTVHILVGLSVIGLVLLQHGKGADMGAAFGGGASGSLFGASGSANFLSRTTAVLATAFFITSLGLSYVAGSRPKAPTSVMEAPVKPAPVSPPADAKSKIPSSEGAASTPVPTPVVPTDKATPAAGKQTAAESSSDAGKGSTAPSAKPKTTVPAGKADTPASKGGESSSKSAAPAGKKAPDAASAPSSSESKAKEIPK